MKSCDKETVELVRELRDAIAVILSVESDKLDPIALGNAVRGTLRRANEWLEEHK